MRGGPERPTGAATDPALAPRYTPPATDPALASRYTPPVAEPALTLRYTPPATDPALTLRYDRPATDWETESLPIGNGALGASVFGGIHTERLPYNEKSLWTGGPGGADGPYRHGDRALPRPTALDEVRARIDRDGRVPPEAVAAELAGPRAGFGAYQPFGEVRLELGGTSAGPVDDYRRELDLAEATVRVGYRRDGVRHLREYLASFPANVIVVRLTADRAGQISFTLRHRCPHAGHTVTVTGDRLTVRGALPDNGLVYESQLRVVVEGGILTSAGDRITVSGADRATIVLSAGTDYAPEYPHYRGADPHDRVRRAVDDAAGLTWAALRQAHLADYTALFDRVRLDLGQRMPDLTTDRLRVAYTGGDGAADRALEALFFAYGRYLLISSSRPGSLPANLQGVWNTSVSPAWSADYHVNINLQMNYWPAEATNLDETAQPLFDLVEALRAPGRRSALTLFGSPGWVVQNETTPYGYTGVHDWPTAFWFPEANAWLCRHLYDHFRFGRDVGFLRDRAYPTMLEAAEFWLANLHTDPRDGTLVVSPSYSPEHGDFTAGAAMSQQIVRELLADTLAAATLLDRDPVLRGRLRSALDRLDPGLRIGCWGQVQEWKGDWDDRTDTHRHVSHLFALHPGRQLRVLDDPGLADAARVTLEARGDGGTGWSKAWKISFWARLRDGDRARKLLGEQLRESTLPNLWDTHPPFQLDGNLGAVAGMAEMLLQSQHDIIDLLPALPGGWAAGSVTGLRARGNVTVDVWWRDRVATRIVLAAGSSGELTVRSPLLLTAPVVDLDTGRTVAVVRNGPEVTFAAVAGHRYRAEA
ncbi:glycoside hydrolase family 95 protein [Micromonospora sp. NBC_01699]|uniref:glycoside hydrolase family 95 protein n=1 Tax=Micromonospora sp. NBC_01699 TaxID=2975984 RepID=UPI002E3497F3|nr:glycoside hydrolase family 95 protein [Micromonospora sp. NBC_01699]